MDSSQRESIVVEDGGFSSTAANAAPLLKAPTDAIIPNSRTGAPGRVPEATTVYRSALCIRLGITRSPKLGLVLVLLRSLHLIMECSETLLRLSIKNLPRPMDVLQSNLERARIDERTPFGFSKDEQLLLTIHADVIRNPSTSGAFVSMIILN